MLLDDQGVSEGSNGQKIISVWCECWTEVSSSKKSCPKFFLANDMWIRDTPLEFHNMTLPEQQLVALLYPQVHVFKLFLKKIQGMRDASMLQDGMCRNATTFKLDNPEIAKMLEDKLMPHPPAILASVIMFTFVDLGKLPKSWLRNTFQIRWHVVAAAFLWLKRWNPKCYGQLKISEERLKSLSEDDIPDEIMSVICQSDEVGMVDKEGASCYLMKMHTVCSPHLVHLYSDLTLGPETMLVVRLIAISNHIEEKVCVWAMLWSTLSSSSTVIVQAPNVIPLQISGTIDMELTKLTGDELMKWGLLNLWKTSDEGAYAVWHGAEPANDFGQPYHSQDNGQDYSQETGLNYSKKAFSLLFSYGHGGIESDKSNQVSFSDHVRWALQYHDAQFCHHETSPFVAFGIQQCCQALVPLNFRLVSAILTNRLRSYPQSV